MESAEEWQMAQEDPQLAKRVVGRDEWQVCTGVVNGWFVPIVARSSTSPAH